MYISIGSIIIDDIVQPEGITCMELIGGGSSHAGMGIRLWAHHVGLLSGIGADFPQKKMQEIIRVFDTRGILTRRTRTPRAWQLLEADGRRTELFRTPECELAQMELVPNEYPFGDNAIEGVHLQSPIDYVSDWVAFLQSKGCRFILWEPWDTDCTQTNRTKLFSLLRVVDTISLSYHEAQNVTSLTSPLEIIKKLLAGGAKSVFLRMGAKGSLVASSINDHISSISSIPMESVVDTTGAGNAYGGGVVAGYCITGDLVEAGRYGAVSASFALSQFGALYSLENISDTLQRRLLECKVIPYQE